MTITYSPSTPPRSPNQAAPFVSPNPSVSTRSSQRLRDRRARETEALQRELFRMERKLKREIRFTMDRYKRLLSEFHNLHDDFGLNSKHHTSLSDSTSREAYNLKCPSSYYSFNSKTKRAHRQVRRTNLYSQPNKRQRTH